LVNKVNSLSLKVITSSFICTRLHGILFLLDSNHNDPRDNPKYYWLKFTSFNPFEYKLSGSLPSTL